MFASMDLNSTPKRLPAEQGKKSVSESFQKEGHEVKSQAPLLLKLNQIRENTHQSVKDRIDRIATPTKSGFAMARLV